MSFSHFHRGLGSWEGRNEEFAQDFISDDIMYTPFWPHVMGFWKIRNKPNILFTSYEAMQENLPAVLTKLAKFLGKPSLSEKQISKLVKHLSFNQMQGKLKFVKFFKKITLTHSERNDQSNWTNQKSQP